MAKKLTGLVAAVCLLCVLVTASAANSRDLKVYQNKTHGFSLQYPADWRSKEGIMDSVVAFMSAAEPDGGPHFNTNVTVENVQAYRGLTLEQYTASSLAHLKRGFADFQLIDNQPYTLAGQPARLLTYRFRQGGYTLIAMQVCTLYKNKAYVIVAGTEKNLFPQYETTARTLFDSFTLN